MKSLLIHLSGHLSAELGSDLYLRIKDASLAPHLFCIELSSLDSVDEVGIEYLKKISSRAKETGSKVALSGVSEEWKKVLEEFGIGSLFPSFGNSAEAKQDLEKNLITELPANQARPDLEEKPVLVPSSEETEISLEREVEIKTVFCPECGQTLKWSRPGNYKCPSCSSKFLINPKGWVSVYERLI
ncbi:STAS domain-containing protein [Leptospira ilyithenensis]|uniref:STAS domain-containing protein n=1 Tax=Leptospira ilyithenensis TaxID=2484901 RepID=A0A4R9LWZ4_9LEPT|nr:STAS domain-containing protein [Leptospira ilyithenensis]TGN14682.1 STAS domain-containing protein [Leptospira ilyithenensis]